MSKEEVRPLRYGALHSATGCFARGSFAEHPEAEPRDMPPTVPLAKHPWSEAEGAKRGAKGGELTVAWRWVMGVPRE